MHDQKEIDEKWIKVLGRELSPEEEDRFFEELKDPREKIFFEELEGLWRLTKLVQPPVIDLEAEYSFLEKRIKNKAAKIIPIGLGVDSGMKQLAIKKFGLFRKLLLSAACILMIFLSTRYFFLSAWFDKINIPKAKESVEQIVVLREEANHTDQIKEFLLEDGSRVFLYPESKLSYTNSFATQRNLKLIGKARFKVAKDKTSPFSVIGQNLKTTALGTEFTVIAYPHSKTIVIRLHEGKVEVSSAYNSKKQISYYLKPGDALHFDKKTFKAKIISVKMAKSHKKLVIGNKVLSRQEEQTNSWYMFNNQPLEEVFDYLAMHYNKRLLYSKKDLAGRMFIGKFKNADSLESILEQIAEINELKIKNDKGHYTIYRYRK